MSSIVDVNKTSRQFLAAAGKYLQWRVPDFSSQDWSKHSHFSPIFTDFYDMNPFSYLFPLEQIIAHGL
jgi:hypothetical protein